MNHWVDRLASKLWVVALIITFILAAFFWRCFLPGWVHFSNDGPLGVIKSEWMQLPGSMLAAWNDLNSIGFKNQVFPPTVTTLIRWVLGPVGYAKYLAPISLLIAGLAGWFCFRRLGLAPTACLAGAVAVTLNADFFSTACWGVASQVITFAMAFVAVALIVSIKPTDPLLLKAARLIVAGAAVGIGVTEGADIGAIFSVFVAAFAIFHCLATDSTNPIPKRLLRGIGTVAAIAICAAIVASHAIFSFVQTSIKGVAIVSQEDPERRWDWATQWSLPKTETLALVIPGLFGYRMDTPNGGMYWGAVGRDPNWDKYFAGKLDSPPPGFLRYTGGSNYLGCVVWLTAIWAIARALKKTHPTPLNTYTRRFVLFWGAVAIISLLFAFGRHAPFYTIVYSLPYFSTIRNPAKFLHVFTWAMLFISAVGIHDLIKLHVKGSTPQLQKLKIPEIIKNLRGFEARWVTSIWVVIGLFVLGFLVYLSATQDLISYLTSEKGQFDTATAHQIAKFSQTQYAWFLVFIVLTGATLTLTAAGFFVGRRGQIFTPLILLLMIAELGRANTHWTIFWYYPEKYTSDPIVEYLCKKPYEGRVAIYPFPAPPNQSLLNGYYTIEWAQHQFQFYNVQSIDIVQMPRMPEDLRAYEMALFFDGSSSSLYKVARRWTLTNTRYIIAPTKTQLPFGDVDTLEFLNKWVANESNAFKPVLYFNLVPKPGITTPTKFEHLMPVLTSNGPYFLAEFTKALPRAKLFPNWVTIKDDQEVLNTLTSTNFNPHELVILSTPADPAINTNQPCSDSNCVVRFKNYHPYKIELETDSDKPCILLLNDKYDSDWHVTVDDQPTPLLRANFIMRGALIPAGKHHVTFSYSPTLTPFYITTSAIVFTLIMLLVCIIKEHSVHDKNTNQLIP